MFLVFLVFVFYILYFIFCDFSQISLKLFPKIKIETYEDEIWKNLKDSIFDEVNKFVNYKVSNYGRVKGHNGKII